MNNTTKIEPKKLVSLYFKLLGKKDVELCFDAVGPIIDFSNIPEFSELKRLKLIHRNSKAPHIALNLNKVQKGERSYNADHVYSIMKKYLRQRVKLMDSLYVQNLLLKELVDRGAPITIYSTIKDIDVWKEIISFIVFKLLHIHRVTIKFNQEGHFFIRNIRFITVNNPKNLNSRTGGGRLAIFDDNEENLNKFEDVAKEEGLKNQYYLIEENYYEIDQAVNKELIDELGIIKSFKIPFIEKIFLPPVWLKNLLSPILIITSAFLGAYGEHTFDKIYPDKVQLTIDWKDKIPASAKIKVNNNTPDGIAYISQSKVVINDVYPGIAYIYVDFDIDEVRDFSCETYIPVKREFVLTFDKFNWDEIIELFPNDTTNTPSDAQSNTLYIGECDYNKSTPNQAKSI